MKEYYVKDPCGKIFQVEDSFRAMDLEINIPVVWVDIVTIAEIRK